MTTEIPTPQPVSDVLPPLSPSDEHTWAMLAHLSVLVNLITGFLGPLAALIIYLVFKDRSRYVAYQSLQSIIFQLIAWLGAGILATFLWIAAIVLTFVCVGIVLYPLAIALSLVPIAAIGYGIYAAVQCSDGKDFQYWQIGDWVRGIYVQ
jgi:uncharacterized Tic20 family protein